MIAEDIITKAKQLNACDLIHEGMSADEIVDLAFAPQGWEFCRKHNFPSLGDIEALQAARTAKGGVVIVVDSDTYVQGGAHNILVAGKSNVDIVCDRVDKTYHVMLYHGARATIYASGYAVVHCVKVGEGCELKFINTDKTSVLL